MTKTEYERGQYFGQCLINLRDDFMLGRRTQIDADAKSLHEAWNDLTDRQKNEHKEKAMKFIKLFIKHLPKVGGNEFLEDLRQTFNQESDMPEPQPFAAMQIFRNLMTEMENME